MYGVLTWTGSIRYQVVLFSMVTLSVMGSCLRCCMSPHARCEQDRMGLA
jgi:hypothetical protein